MRSIQMSVADLGQTKQHGLIAKTSHWWSVVVLAYALLKQLTALELLEAATWLKCEET